MRKRLASKLWKESEISHAQRALSKAGRLKHPGVEMVEKSMSWFTAILAVLSAIIVSLLMLPVLVAGNTYQAAFMSLLFGFLAGLLISYISVRMHWMMEKHHLLIVLAVAASGVASLFYATNLANDFNAAISAQSLHDPLMLAFYYFLGYLAPYSAITAFKAIKGWNA